jgi:hypothetical protein
VQYDRKTSIGEPYLPKFTNVSDSLALQGAEILRNAAILEIDNSSERFIKERSCRDDREVAGFGLVFMSVLVDIFRQVDQTAKVWIMALKPMSTLPLPIISVTSEGSLLSKMATLIPCSAK